MEILKQLQGLSGTLGSLAQQIQPLLAVLAIAGGAIACFGGGRVAKALLAVTGFLAGAALASVLTLLVTSGNTDALLIPALVGGALVAGLSLAVFYAGLFFGGALAGAFLAGALGAIANAPPNTLAVIALAVLGGCAFVVGEKTALTLTSAFAGAWALVSGISRLAGGGWLDLVAFVREPASVGFDTTVLFLCWLMAGLAGAFAQSGRVGALRLPVPNSQRQGLFIMGAALLMGVSLCAIVVSAQVSNSPSIPVRTRATAVGNTTPQSTTVPGTDSTTTASSATATALAAPIPTATATLVAIAPTAIRLPSPTPTRDPATYPFQSDGGPTVDRNRVCIGGYYIFGTVKDRLGQTLNGVRIKYGTATFFPPVAVTEAKGYELTVGAADVEWYVRVVDENDQEQSPVVIVRTAGLQNGDCWFRLDWRKK